MPAAGGKLAILVLAIFAVTSVAVLRAVAQPAPPVRVVALETDATAEPLGIDDPAPRFTWRLEATRPAIRQTAYRVIVATSEQAAAAGQREDLVWDSKEVRTGDPFAIYAGPALRSRTRYYWSVQVTIAAVRRPYASAVSWFETAYMRPAEWSGAWIAGPQRLETPPTAAQGAADDACCLAVETTLYAPTAAGATNMKVNSTAGFVPRRRFEVGGEVAYPTEVGTAAATTVLAVAAPAGATNVKAAGVQGFAAGQDITIGAQHAVIEAVGTAASKASLAAAAAPGATTLQAAPAGMAPGGGRSAAPVFQAGEGIIIDGETRTIAEVRAAPGSRGGFPGRGPRNITVAVTTPFASAHPRGATVLSPGSGITFSPALLTAQAAGAAVSTPGTGVTFAPALRSPHPANTAIHGDAAPDFCRPPGGRDNSGACREVRPAPMLRKTFLVDPVSRHGKVVSARVYAAGLAYDNLTLNGARTGPRALSPGFTNYADTVLYTTDDVTKLVRQQQDSAAENVIAAQLGSGQFDDETTSNDWHWEDAEWRATPRLRLDLYITYSDGTAQLVKSDGSWQANVEGPWRYDGYYLGETYDARKEIPGWNEPGLNSSLWPAARVVEAPKGVLRAERQEPTRVVARWPAGKRTNPKPGVFVYDAGKLIAGWATISVWGAPAGTAIQIFYSDKTAADGTVSSSGFTPNGQIQTDYYIAKGTGTVKAPETFAPQFTYKGFRYVQISAPSHPASTSGGIPQALPAGVEVRVDSLQETRTAMAVTGQFHASNPLLERIEAVTRDSIAASYVAGIITDTPEYEKNGWTGDAQLSAPAASLFFDTERQYWKSFQDMVDNQVADTGELTLLAPTNKGYGHVGQTFKNAANAGATPVWDAFWFVIPWEAYLRYGDARALQMTYPLMRKYLDHWIPQWTSKDGDAYHYTLTSGLGDWDPPTGADAADGAPTRVSIPTVIAPATTAYYAYMAKIAADSARALGQKEQAAHFDRVFARIKTDFNAKWWDAAAGYYRENPKQMFVQTMQVLPLAFGLVPDERRAALQAKLVEDVMKTRGGHEEVGIAGSRWILPVLSQAAEEGVAGAADAAYAIATQTTYPGYGYWLGLGWAGLGESWERSSRTRSHHMFGGIGQWFYEHLAGIRPLEPGYGRIAFQPAIPAGLDRAEATYESVRGEVAASWRRIGSRLVLEVTVPPNASGMVYVPASDPGQVTVSDTRNTKLAGRQATRIVYRVESGSYSFTVGGSGGHGSN